MVRLAIGFPGGRYHATPWGQHVNEGLVEWPPSPWRLLRALLATGYTKLGWGNVPASAASLFERLAETPPRFRLPAATLAHSRHYMPIGTLAKGTEKTTLVFDAWASVGDGELVVEWPVDLDAGQRQLFGTLVEALGYLGRSESWVSARLVDDPAPGALEANAFPADGVPNPGPGWEQVGLLTPEAPADYARWRQAAVSEALAPFPLPEGRKPTKSLLGKRAKAEAPFPPDLLTCLHAETATLRKHGWSQPPGARRLLYWRRADCLAMTPARPITRRPVAPVAAMLLAMMPPSRNRHALPHRYRTLPQAELLHRAFVSALNADGRADAGGELTGRDDEGRPLSGPHLHAHLLPLDLDGDQHLDHVLVWAPGGLGAAAQQAVRSIRRTYGKKLGEFDVALVASGELDMLRALPEPHGIAMEALLGPAPGARCWRSVTPFVAPRHLKVRGRNTLVGQVQAELASRGLSTAVAVEVLDREASLHAGMRHFVRTRSRGGAPPPVDTGHALRLTFETPVHGPLLIGYGSHFGLGQFTATQD